MILMFWPIFRLIKYVDFIFFVDKYKNSKILTYLNKYKIKTYIYIYIYIANNSEIVHQYKLISKYFFSLIKLKWLPLRN